MSYIIRARIFGAKTDADLYALDGIKKFIYNSDDYHEVLDAFEKKYPSFIVGSIQPIYS